ncbi:MAG: hypothetical protein WBI04_06945 [Trichlorobacter sp.]|jgi:hypothetical protein
MATNSLAADKEDRLQKCRTIMANQPRLISYSWEEFITRLAQIDDPALRAIGQQELAKLHQPQQRPRG